MNDEIKRALAHVEGRSDLNPDGLNHSITLNFHPDLVIEDQLVIDRIADQGMYRSQYETGISSGGMTAYRGGDRWKWESAIFGSAYDNAQPFLRPKYGAFNYQELSTGGSMRFGSCHLRLAAHVRERTSFCYPDSHLEPEDFAVKDVRQLVALATKNERCLDPQLDNYIEAHVHGPVDIGQDCDAIILDPSYRGTSVEISAKSLECELEWHEGFRLHTDRLSECAEFRGEEVADAIATIAVGSVVTPAILGRARQSIFDYQMAKWVWHCVAKFGQNKTRLA